MTESNGFIPLNFTVQEPQDMQQSAQSFYQQMATRRSVRDFSDKPIPDAVLEHAILAAGTAPSGANMQPWHFVVVQSPELKAQIRQAAEKGLGVLQRGWCFLLNRPSRSLCPPGRRRLICRLLGFSFS